MRLRLISAACGMLLLSLGVPAWGVNCYQIWDASDTLVYQSISPPFDLARPAFDRAMANLRSQRRTFIFFDTPACAITGTSMVRPQGGGASSDPASILDIRSGAGPGGRSSGGGGPVGTAAPGGAAPAAGMNLRSSTPAGMGLGRAY